jgi:NAD(P)-dependent dehydrogenase (short-subunit alcohol dehydrogenase family)
MVTKRNSTTTSQPTLRKSGSAAKAQRSAQRQQEEADRGKPLLTQSKAAVQAGPRTQPVRLPRQHLKKPAHESRLALAPRYLAPDYLGSGKLAGKIGLVTGGDSGIGRAVSVLFAREGADVAIVYLNEHDDARVTKEAIEREGRRCVLIPGDVRQPAFCRRAVATTLRTFGALDVLVNNAAFQEHSDSIESLSELRFDLTLKTNVYGYFNMAKAAVPHLKAGSAIINTGSVTGLEGAAHLLDYAATKGAIHAFTKSLASQLLPRHIRVNAVAPGPVWTPLNPADKRAGQVPTFGHATDMKRAAQPEEISPAYVFLAAGVCSGYISGVVLPITGSVGAI